MLHALELEFSLLVIYSISRRDEVSRMSRSLFTSMCSFSVAELWSKSCAFEVMGLSERVNEEGKGKM